jgi:hypothetical protein
MMFPPPNDFVVFEQIIVQRLADRAPFITCSLGNKDA